MAKLSPEARRVGHAAQLFATTTRTATRAMQQYDRWGKPDHPDGINEDGDMDAALDARLTTDAQRTLLGEPTWRTLLDEEVAKLYAARTPTEAADHLLDVAALAASWHAALQDRTGSRLYAPGEPGADRERRRAGGQ